MKAKLREIYGKNRRDFDVWNFLWLHSGDNNSIEFSHNELCGRFNLPPSSLHRILNIYPDKWNQEKTYVEYSKVEYKKFRVTFYPKGKRSRIETQTIYDGLYVWVKGYYKEIGFDYADISKHKKYVKIICGKIAKAMADKNTEVTDDSISDTFRFFINSIDGWWKESGNITLPLISKHFTKILNQVKTSSNGKKRDSYSKAAEQVDSVDFGKLTRNH